MSKRQLSSEEKILCNKSIKRFTEENVDLDYVLADAELKFNRGLDYSYRKQKKEYSDAIKELKGKIESNNQQIEILEKQVKEGVEKKEIKGVS